MPVFSYATVIPARPIAVFRFHERADVLPRLTPWWSGARIVEPAASLRPGQLARLRLGPPGPLVLDWVAEHTRYQPPHLFEERQLPGQGPFVRWRHRHLMLDHPRGTLLRDEVVYQPPGGPLAPLLDHLLLRPFLRLIFRHRHRVTRATLANEPA